MIFGLSSIILAAIIITITTTQLLDNSTIKILTIICAVIVASLSGLQTFLNPSELAEKYGRRSDEYESLRHELEQVLEFFNGDEPSLSDALFRIREKWGEIPSMNTSDRSFNKAGKIVKAYGRYPEKLILKDKIPQLGSTTESSNVSELA